MKPIIVKDGKRPVFLLSTLHTSYMFRIDEYGHPEHIHYGRKVDIEDADALSMKRTVPYGDSVYYDEKKDVSCQDDILLEWAGNGRGDYRPSPIDIEKRSGVTTDFIYESYETGKEKAIENGLPSAYGSEQELIVHLVDQTASLRLDLHYAVYPDCDVIARRTVLVNKSQEAVKIHKLMSLCVDMLDDDLIMMTFNGGWAHEMHLSERKVEIGELVSASRVGFSSSRTNPGFLLRDSHTDEDQGECYGFNLVWSGNHYSSVYRDDHDDVRIMTGINPERFTWQLEPDDAFCTPQAVMTFSDQGMNDLSHHFHDFVNEHLVRGTWKKKERPVLVNDWEAFMFDFNEDKLIALAKSGKELGAELFVLDDGWFGARNNDHAGLGDYDVNQKKLPHGIRGLSDSIHAMGMLFGLWFEPEAVNPDSDLYRKHPEWVLQDGEYRTLYGRNELLLDLTRSDVRNYIVDSVSKVLDEGNVDYVKWDMNRQMTHGDGAFSYRYIQGLYECLDRIFSKRPHILLESCSSGGNRFDLGMMCFSPQIWASDDTDAIERLDIQRGYSYLYPQSTIGAHVSAVPNAQTMRSVPLHTRFNAAAFGAFGYELDVDELSGVEKKEVRREISFYKQYRSLFQYGAFRRENRRDNHETFSVSNDTEAIISVFRKCVPAASAHEKLRVKGLSQGRYQAEVRRALMPVPSEKLGYIAKMAQTADGPYDGQMAVLTEEESFTASSDALAAGIPLNNVFNGSGYNEHVRFPQDFGSELYVLKKL